MPVVPRGNGFQADFMCGGRRVRKSCKTPQEAEKFEREYLAKHTLGMIGPDAVDDASSPKTLGQLFDWAKENVWKGSKSMSTVECNTGIILDIMGEDTLIAGIKTTHVDNLILALARDRKAEGSTINRKIAALSKALRIAQRRGWIERLPEFRRQKEKRGRLRWLSDEEEAAILRYISGRGPEEQEFKDLFIFLLDTGCRLSEALTKLNRDIDLKRNLIHFWETKNDHPRSIPMTSRVQEIVKRRMVDDGGTLFTMNKNQSENRWERMRTLLGMDHDTQFVLHMLRHTCASRLVQRGIDLYVVKEWLGHRSIKTTERYAHLAPKQLVNAAKVLEGVAVAGQIGYPVQSQAVA